MAKKPVSVVSLSGLESGDQGDCFLLLVSRERGTTRDGKPYYRVTFRDPERSATTMVWQDSGLYADCEQNWSEGEFYKIRCTYFENQYGPGIEVEKIRRVEAADRDQGFDPSGYFIRSRFDVEEMYRELLAIAEQEISEPGLRELVCTLLAEHAAQLKVMSAASRNHHAFSGGYLEHVLSVTKTSLFLADKYQAYYPAMNPPLNRSLVVAGAILHDIGKMIELDHKPGKTDYTARGRLIGHILLGRDLVRNKALELGCLSEEMLLRIEHLIVAHQGIPEYGSPVEPATPEALLVHFADDLDAKYNMLFNALAETPGSEEFSSRDNPLRRRFFRGFEEYRLSSE